MQRHNGMNLIKKQFNLLCKRMSWRVDTELCAFKITSSNSFLRRECYKRLT